jgi:hypothetical protein
VRYASDIFVAHAMCRLSDHGAQPIVNERCRTSGFGLAGFLETVRRGQPVRRAFRARKRGWRAAGLPQAPADPPARFHVRSFVQRAADRVQAICSDTADADLIESITCCNASMHTRLRARNCRSVADRGANVTDVMQPDTQAERRITSYCAFGALGVARSRLKRPRRARDRIPGYRSRTCCPLPVRCLHGSHRPGR